MGEGSATSARRRSLAHRRAPRVRGEEILSCQLARRDGLARLGCDDQGTMGLRTGSSTAEGGTRARPLRGKVLSRPSSSRAYDNAPIRIPPTSPPPKSETEKKESTGRRLNPRYQPSATPSSISSFDQALGGVRTAKSGSAGKSSVSKSAKVVLGRGLIKAQP